MKGVYCLIIKVPKTKEILIGKLKKIKFEKGRYLYLGSAQNNLEKRVERHFKKRKKKFWHIDYLLAEKEIEIEKAILFLDKRKNYECFLARKFSKRGEPVKNFGCSDCSCQSHLIKLEDEFFEKLLAKKKI